MPYAIRCLAVAATAGCGGAPPYSIRWISSDTPADHQPFLNWNTMRQLTLALTFARRLLPALLIAVASISHAQTSSYEARRAPAALTIDGSLTESAWAVATSASTQRVVIGSTANNTVTFSALWDSTYLYVGIRVLDGNLHNDSASTWLDDNIEIYIDANHNHETSYDSHDRQFTKGWNDTSFGERNGNTSGVLQGWAAIPGGYTVEMGIPWSNLGVTPTAGMTIGFDIGNNDDDNGGDTREVQLMWNGTVNNYQDTSNFGHLTLSATAEDVYEAKNTFNAPTIDGSLSEPAWSQEREASKLVIGSTKNNTVTFGTLWDDNYLYVGIQVLDGDLHNDSPDVWLDDAVEVYVDANHNRGTTYDSYDRQFTKGWNDSTVGERNGNTSGVLHAWAPVTGGYTIEMAIPWSNLGISPTPGMTIGFDIGNNDDDNGGNTREAQVMWFGTINNYRDTSNFGALTLSAPTAGGDSTIHREAEEYSAMSGVSEAGGHITSFNNGDWVRFNAINLDAGFLTFQARVASSNSAADYGKIDVRLDSTTGPLIASLRVLNTGGDDAWEVQTAQVTMGTGVHDVYLVASGGSGNSVCNLDWIKLRRDMLPRGATMPFITYEAETGTYTGTLNGSSDSFHRYGASGRQYVWLSATGQYVQWTASQPANHLTLRYGVPLNSLGTISVFVNDTLHVVSVSGTHCYDSSAVTSKPRRYDEVMIPVAVAAGDSIKVQKRSTDTLSWYAIDLIDLELAPPAAEMPAGFVSVTDCGAVPNDGLKDNQAIKDCLAAAAAGNKKVFFPPGTFTIENERIAVPAEIELRGAGLWYTKIHNPSQAAFSGDNSNKGGFTMGMNSSLRDLKFTGVATSRGTGMRAIDPDPNGPTGIVVENVLVQNIGVLIGWRVYSNSTFRNIRFIGNYYDGIHFGDGAVQNNLVENCFFRGMGDDSIAQVNRSDMGLATGNVAQFNTMIATYWGRNIANLGGADFIARDNYIDGGYLAGAYIATERLTPSISRPINGFKFQRNTVLRSGHTGHGHGGIHFWLRENPMQDVRIEDCRIEYCETFGIRIDDTNYGDSGGRTQFNYNVAANNARGNYSDASPEIDPIRTGNTGF